MSNPSLQALATPMWPFLALAIDALLLQVQLKTRSLLKQVAPGRRMAQFFLASLISCKPSYFMFRLIQNVPYASLYQYSDYPVVLMGLGCLNANLDCSTPGLTVISPLIDGVLS